MMARLAALLRQAIGKSSRSHRTKSIATRDHSDPGKVPLTVLVHDFGNLLNVISASAAGMRDRLPAGVIHREFDDLSRAVTEAAALTREFLLAGHAPSAARQRMDLNRFINLALDTFARLAGNTILVRPQLWAEPVMINAEVPDVERILLNLVLNARDAMPDGGVLTLETAVVVESSSADEIAIVKPRARLRVSDTGYGMRPEVKARMFEPYFTTRSGATGLGANSIAFTVVRLGGTLLVESSPAGGTCVTVYFPLTSVR